MTVYNGFVSPTLGMMAQAHALNTIGVNLANVNTGGFKSTETRFSTVLSDTLDKQSDLGGVKPKDYQRIDQQGFIVSSLGDLDVAINGRGYFIVNSKFDGSGQTLYTRDGSFQVATEGTDTATVNGASITVKKAYLVDKNGYFVQGLERDATTGTFPLTSTLNPLRVDQFAFSNTGEVTTTAELRLNLPANDTPSTAQIDTVTLAGLVEAGDVYSVTVDGTPASYTTTGAEANLDAVRDALVAAINANATVGAVVTAAARAPKIGSMRRAMMAAGTTTAVQWPIAAASLTPKEPVMTATRKRGTIRPMGTTTSRPMPAARTTRRPPARQPASPARRTKLPLTAGRRPKEQPSRTATPRRQAPIPTPAPL